MGRRRNRIGDVGCLIIVGAVVVLCFVVPKVGKEFADLFGGGDEFTIGVGVVAFMACVVTGTVVLIRFSAQQARIQAAHERARAIAISDVDFMDGIAFEHYVARILAHRGFQVTMTKASGDFGVDIVAQNGPIKYAIQVMRHLGSVSRRAVSDAVAAKDHYGCNAAMVVTNSYFSRGAIRFARSTRCELVDRQVLAEWIVAFQRGA